MAPSELRSLARSGYALALLAVLMFAVGCEKGTKSTESEKEPVKAINRLGGAAESVANDTKPAESDGASGKTVPNSANYDAAALLKELVATYQQAKSYEDAGELHLAVEGPNGEKQESQQPIPFSIAFERPNKIRIHALEAGVVADGKYLRASIVPLEGQVLVLPDPEKLSVATFESDTMLNQAMRGQLNVPMPQLALLLEEDPLKQLTGGEAPKALDDADYQGENCHRVSVDSAEGPSVFWISPKTKLLVKFEFPPEGLKKKFSLADASIWAEFKGARVNATISEDAFKFDVPAGVKQLKRFLPPPPDPPSALLGQTPADFSFQDFRGGDVTRESLKGKVVVLDLWATWCSWCFEGFPNLQKVYDQFKDNDKVAILAVDTDEPTITDERVKQAFEKARLTIPIVRDQRQFNTDVFKVQGLPTMVILGADGTVEEVHVGYDEHLAETLPKKLERLLAGESVAKDELAKYDEARKKYEQELADALVTDDGDAAK